jgi:hypothetical protein
LLYYEEPSIVIAAFLLPFSLAWGVLKFGVCVILLHSIRSPGNNYMSSALSSVAIINQCEDVIIRGGLA